MRAPRPPLFLARTVYRKRRLRDAARLVPLVGMFLLVLPLFWGPTATAGAVWIYLLVVWAGLILAAAALARGLAAEGDPAEDDGDR